MFPHLSQLTKQMCIGTVGVFGNMLGKKTKHYFVCSFHVASGAEIALFTFMVYTACFVVKRRMKMWLYCSNFNLFLLEVEFNIWVVSDQVELTCVFKYSFMSPQRGLWGFFLRINRSVGSLLSRSQSFRRKACFASVRDISLCFTSLSLCKHIQL